VPRGKGASHHIWRRWIHIRSRSPGCGDWHLCRAGVAWVAILSLAAAAPPEATRIFPPGVQRGATATVKVSGAFPVWPVTAWTDRPGTTWEPQAESGTYLVAAAADAPLGLHLVRFTSPEGSSAPRRFVVGHLPQLVETEPNDRPALPDRADRPGAFDGAAVVVDGVLAAAGDADCHRVHLAAGELLVAQADAHRLLRSPADLVLDVVDAAGNLHARNLDAAGLDPRVAFTAPAEGEYAVRVWGFPENPDSTIGLAGGEGFVYRLVLGRGRFLAGTLPLATSVGADAALEPLGFGLEGAAPIALAGAATASAGDAGGTVAVAIDGVAGMAEVAVVPRPVVAGGDAAVAAPVTFSGVLRAPGAVARHRVSAAAGAKLSFVVEGVAIGTLLDPLLAIRDEAGALLASTDDLPGRIAWTAPADGTVVAEIRDRRDQGSPAHGYRLTVTPDLPSVAVTSAVDRVTGKAGAAMEVALEVRREHGHAAVLEVVLVDPPEGVSAAPATSAAEGDSSKNVTLAITAAGPLSAPVRIVARDAAAAGAPPLPVRFGPEGLDTLWLGVTPP